MEVKAKLSHLRITPRKVRLVADMVRGKKTEQAQVLLRFSAVKSGQVILKLLNSAIANAKHNFKLEESNLYISSIFVDEGPKLKRFRPVSRGSAHPLWRRNSHVTIILSEISPDGIKAKTADKSALSEKAEKTESANRAEINKPIGAVRSGEKALGHSHTGEARFGRESKKAAKTTSGSTNKMFRRKSV